MFSDDEKFKDGVERGISGKSHAQGFLDIPFDSDSDKATRQRGYKAGAAAKATADFFSKRIFNRNNSKNADSEPLFLIRRWFPELFPWSEDQATDHIINISAVAFGLCGLSFGFYQGYEGTGIGAGIVWGLVLGVIGAIIGALASLIGATMIAAILNLAIIITPILFVLWLLSLIWDSKL